MGFVFDNYARNMRLEAGGAKAPVMRKTGTTICGVACKDAVVLAADTRATEGPIVADKNCEKLHRLANRIFCAGAGTSADLEHTTKLMESNLELHRLATGRDPRVATVVTRMSQKLYEYQGHLGCALVLGGVDIEGPHLYKIHPHGSTDRLPFAAMGSGSLNAMAVLEDQYKDDMSIEEAKALVIKAIKSGIFNDLGSGSNVDVVVIEQAAPQATILRNIETPNERAFRMPRSVAFPPGTTPTLWESKTDHQGRLLVQDVTMA